MQNECCSDTYKYYTSIINKELTVNSVTYSDACYSGSGLVYLNIPGSYLMKLIDPL